jgi:hypothetical protein
MQTPDFLLTFIRRLNLTQCPYMITGAAASIIYGEPRLTNDLDLVLDLKKSEIPGFAQAFPLEEFYCPPEEVIILEIGRPVRGHFNLIHHETGFRADVYLAGKDPLHHWGLANRKSVQVEDQAVWVAPVEYVILRKLEYYREGRSEKHLKDIVGMLEVSEAQVNMAWLEEHIAERQLQDEWQAAKQFLDYLK